MIVGRPETLHVPPKHLNVGRPHQVLLHDGQPLLTPATLRGGGSGILRNDWHCVVHAPINTAARDGAQVKILLNVRNDRVKDSIGAPPMSLTGVSPMVSSFGSS